MKTIPSITWLCPSKLAPRWNSSQNNISICTCILYDDIGANGTGQLYDLMEHLARSDLRPGKQLLP